MDFNREKTIGGSQIAALGNTYQFFEKLELVIVSADMFYDGVGVGYSESIFGERERAAIAGNTPDSWVTLSENAHVAYADSSDVFGVGVVFFEIVVAFRIFYSIDTNINDGII